MARTSTRHRADPTDRIAATHARLVTAVEALTDGEEWRRMLAVAARFPTYSAHNVLLIGVQRPDATRVSGIRTWNSLGRRVCKGEKGIAILAPCLYRQRETEERASHEPRPPTGPSERPVTEAARVLRGFRVVHVFALEQTDGDPLPEVAPTLLRGDAPNQLAERLAETIRADGYTVERGPCEGGANGHTDFATRTVRVRDDVAPAQAVKSLAHELGHIRADHETRFLAQYRTSFGCRAQAEVEAESIAYLVADAAGLPTADYTVPYLAGWSGGDPALLRGAATRAIDTARGIVRDLALDTPFAAAGIGAAPHRPLTPEQPHPGHDPTAR